MPTTNIPTPVALSLPALSLGVERALSRRPLPPGVTGHATQTGTLVITRGSSQLKASPDLVKDLREYTPRTLSHIMRTVPSVAVAMFTASRLDHLDGLEGRGALRLGRMNDDESMCHLRRLARLCGLDPDRLAHTTLVARCMSIIARLEFVFTSGELVAQGVGFLARGEVIESRGVDGYHRGGRWRLGVIHPELFEMSLERFVPVPLELLEAGIDAVNVGLPVLAQATLKRSSRVELAPQRLVTEGGLAETTTRGSARERRRMRSALGELVTRGILASARLVDGVVSLVVSAVSPEPETAPFAAQEPPDHGSRCASSLDPRLLLHCLLNPEQDQTPRRFLGALVISLVRNLEGVAERLSAPAPPPEWEIGPLEDTRVPT